MRHSLCLGPYLRHSQILLSGPRGHCGKVREMSAHKLCRPRAHGSIPGEGHLRQEGGAFPEPRCGPGHMGGGGCVSPGDSPSPLPTSPGPLWGPCAVANWFRDGRRALQENTHTNFPLFLLNRGVCGAGAVGPRCGA